MRIRIEELKREIKKLRKMLRDGGENRSTLYNAKFNSQEQARRYEMALELSDKEDELEELESLRKGGFEMKKEIAEPREVIGSKYIKERKTGAWKAQINELEDGKYSVEVYWDAWHFEVSRDDYYYKIFENEREAQKLYDTLTFDNMKKFLDKR